MKKTSCKANKKRFIAGSQVKEVSKRTKARSSLKNKIQKFKIMLIKKMMIHLP